MTYLVNHRKPTVDENSPAYQAACHGPPLRTIQRRDEAVEQGYEVNRHFDCIDKRSYAEIAKAKAKWQAANTPEAIAKQKAEREKLIAEEQARQAALAQEQEQSQQDQTTTAPEGFVLRNLDVNAATEEELASVTIVGPEIAAQIVEARNKAHFQDWPDLVNRVVGFQSARNALYASISGVNVNGQSLPGASPDPAMGAQIHAQLQGTKRP